MWAPFPWNIKTESSHRRQKGKDPGPGTALPFIPAFTPSPSYLLVPPPTSYSMSGAEVTAPPRGNLGCASISTLSAGQETPLLSDHLLLPRTAYSSPRRPILLQRPVHPRPSHGETSRAQLYPGQSPDPHKHLFDLGVLAPPLCHLSHSINPGFTGARAHAPNPLRRPHAGFATRTSPGVLPLRPFPPSSPPSPSPQRG